MQECDGRFLSATTVEFGGDTRGCMMLEIIAAVVVVLWLLGLVTSHTMGGFIHLLLVIAVVVILVRIIRGRL